METKKLHYALLSFFFLFALSCNNQGMRTTKNSPENTFGELKKFIEKPDSLLTSDEIVKRDKLFNLISEKVIVRDNQFYTTASRKNFTEIGLSTYYYDMLKKSIKEANQWVKNEGVTNLDSMYRSSKESYFLKKN